MTESMKLALGSIVRWALTFAFASLATHKVVDGPLLGVAINDLTAQIVGGLGAATTLGWSQIQKLWMAHRVKTARSGFACAMGRSPLERKVYGDSCFSKRWH